MKKICYLLLLQIIVFLSLIQNSLAQYHFGNVGGLQVSPKLLASFSVKVSGNYAYVVGLQSSALAVLDVSDPENPTPVSNISDGEGGAVLDIPLAVEISGNYAYVLNQGALGSLEVIDISNPLKPMHVANSANGVNGLNISGPRDIDILGNYAYVARFGGVEVIDISNPLAPVSAGQYSGVNSFYEGGSISGNHYYVTAGNPLHVLSLANPIAPVLVDTYTFATGAAISTTSLRSVTASGNYAYLTGNDYLEIVDISTPSDVSFVGGFNNNNNTGETLIFENKAYLGGDQLLIVDISDKATPSLLNAHNVTVRHMALYDHYVLSVSDKLVVINSTNPLNITSKEYFNPAAGLAVSGNYAYVTKSYNALEVVDISMPAFPKVVGSIKHGQGGASLDWPVSVAVSGNYAFVTSTLANAIEVINVSNPATPTHAGSLSDGQGGAKLKKPMSLAIKGNYAYVVSTGSDALEIIDISNPAAPVHGASITSGEQGSSFEGAESITIAGNYVYLVGSNASGMTTIDISNPLSPTFVSTVSLGAAFSLAVSGTHAFANSVSAIEYIDLSNLPPVWGGSVIVDDVNTGVYLASNSTAPQSIAVSGNYLYGLSQERDALTILDVTDAYTPVLVKTIQHQVGGAILDNPRSVTSSGHYIYVASHLSNSLEIVYFNPNTPDEPSITFTSIDKTYGDPDFTLSASSSNSSGTFTYGIVEGTAATVASNGTTSILAADTVDVYAMIASNGTYGPKAIRAELRIAPKAITVSADAGQSKDLNEADPVFTYTVNPALINGDVFTGALTRTSGEAAGSYTLVQGTLSAGSNYQITFTGNTFCINPAKPVISSDVQNANILISSNASGNQWYKDNVLLNGATTATYSVTESGVYTVITTVSGCSSDSSEPETRILSRLVRVTMESIEVYPNPVSQNLMIDLSALSGGSFITIYNSTGKRMMSAENSAGLVVLNFDALEPGMYAVNIQHATSYSTKYIIKK